MKKKIKNSELIKRWLIVLFASLFIGIQIVLFSLSFSSYDDGFGTDISFDMDAIVYLLCGIALLCYGIYSVCVYKKKKDLKLAYYGSFGVIAALITFYPLGTFFKAMAKHKSYLENQEYLYIGLLGIVLILYLTFSYLSDGSKDA